MRAKWLIASLSIISSGLVFANSPGWIPYEQYARRDYNDGVQSPPVAEAVNVGGFKLSLDRTQLGYSVARASRENMLGSLRGTDFDVEISRLPASEEPLDQVAAERRDAHDTVADVAPTRAAHGLKGVRAVYGVRSAYEGVRIRGISYYFVNRSGETICFAAKARACNPNWDYFKYLMTKMLEPARS